MAPLSKTPDKVLLDNSVLQRRDQPRCAEALKTLAAQDWLLLVSCPEQAAEFCFSAPQTDGQYETYRQIIDAWMPLPTAPSVKNVLDLQHRLWVHSLYRAAGAMDTIIAAWALANDACVVHYDHDYEYLAHVEPRLKQYPIAPWGMLK